MDSSGSNYIGYYTLKIRAYVSTYRTVINVPLGYYKSLDWGKFFFRLTENEALQEKHMYYEVEKLRLENTEIDIMKKNYSDMKR